MYTVVYQKNRYICQVGRNILIAVVSKYKMQLQFFGCTQKKKKQKKKYELRNLQCKSSEFTLCSYLSFFLPLPATYAVAALCIFFLSFRGSRWYHHFVCVYVCSFLAHNFHVVKRISTKNILLQFVRQEETSLIEFFSLAMASRNFFFLTFFFCLWLQSLWSCVV